MHCFILFPIFWIKTEMSLSVIGKCALLQIHSYRGWRGFKDSLLFTSNKIHLKESWEDLLLWCKEMLYFKNRATVLSKRWYQCHKGGALWQSFVLNIWELLLNISKKIIIIKWEAHSCKESMQRASVRKTNGSFPVTFPCRALSSVWHPNNEAVIVTVTMF